MECRGRSSGRPDLQAHLKITFLLTKRILMYVYEISDCSVRISIISLVFIKHQSYAAQVLNF